MSKILFGERHLIRGLDAVADAFSGTVTSDFVNVASYQGARFIRHQGVGTTGTSTLTIVAADNAAGDNPVAVPFFSQRFSGDTDVPADVVARTAAGFDTTAGSSQLYVCDVPADKLPAGKPWVALKCVEVADAAVLGGILIELYGPRYAAHVPATAIA